MEPLGVVNRRQEPKASDHLCRQEQRPKVEDLANLFNRRRVPTIRLGAGRDELVIDQVFERGGVISGGILRSCG
jgi:hypothetical protein